MSQNYILPHVIGEAVPGFAKFATHDKSFAISSASTLWRPAIESQRDFVVAK